jgi:hypothetical protein
MEETKEQLFARLEAMGYEKVNEQRQRGLLAGNAIWVNEWLQNRGIARLDEAQALHRRAVYAAERSAAAAERAARFAMFTALIALAVVLMVVTASPAWMARF